MITDGLRRRGKSRNRGAARSGNNVHLLNLKGDRSLFCVQSSEDSSHVYFQASLLARTCTYRYRHIPDSAVSILPPPILRRGYRINVDNALGVDPSTF